MSAKLAGKVAVVTGSGRGIGRAEAMTLARLGASVVVSDFGRDESGRGRADVVVDEIKQAGGEAAAASEDLASPDGARRTIEAAVDTFGGLDFLVNNAGMRAGNPIHKLTEEQWDLVVDTHLKASYLTIRFAIPHMRARGGGVIVNTGSEAGLGMPFNAAYAAAKEGLAGLTRSIAREHGRSNIRCNLIRPRATALGMGGGDWFQKNLAGTWKPLLDALGRNWIGDRGVRWEIKTTADSVAALVAWLCTADAGNVNGQDFFVGGDEIALLTPPQFAKTLFRREGWTVESLTESAPVMTGDLVDRFRVANPFTSDD